MKTKKMKKLLCLASSAPLVRDGAGSVRAAAAAAPSGRGGALLLPPCMARRPAGVEVYLLRYLPH